MQCADRERTDDTVRLASTQRPRAELVMQAVSLLPFPVVRVRSAPIPLTAPDFGMVSLEPGVHRTSNCVLCERPEKTHHPRQACIRESFPVLGDQ
jgi:hypothetical protein